MSLKKFTKTNIGISLLILIISYLLSYYNSHYVDDIKRKLYLYENIPDKNIKVVNVGSSHGRYGIKYKENDKLNLASISQVFYYDLKLLNKYQDKINDEAIIIIPISIMSFYNKDEKNLDKNYSGILEKNKLVNIDKTTYFLQKYFSIYFPPQKLITVIENFKTNKFLIMDGYHNVTLNLEDMKKESKKIAQKHMASRKILGEEDLKQMLKYIEIIDKDAYKIRIYNNIKEIEKKMNKKYLYLDYSHDKRFENKLEYFFDDDHLNKKGAEYFTEILLKDIERKLKNERKI